MAIWLFGWLAIWLTGCLPLPFWLADWRVGWPTGWLAVCSCLAGWLSGWLVGYLARPKKRHVFGRRKNGIFSFFRVRQYGAFWLERFHCGAGYHIYPPTGLNLESAEISTSKLANSKQQMSKSIQQFLKCTLISSPLVRWKWPTQVGTLGTLWWG